MKPKKLLCVLLALTVLASLALTGCSGGKQASGQDHLARIQEAGQIIGARHHHRRHGGHLGPLDLSRRQRGAGRL